MKIDPALIAWLEEELDRIAFGELGLLFHIRNGSIEWTEKIHRETVKKQLHCAPRCDTFEPTE